MRARHRTTRRAPTSRTRASPRPAPWCADADFFPADSEAAFANIVLAGGTASAGAYMTFPFMSRAARAATALTSAVVALFAYGGAEWLHRLYKRAHVRM